MTDPVMKEILWITKDQEKVSTITKMGISIWEIGSKTNSTAKGSTFSPKETDMKDSLKTG